MKRIVTFDKANQPYGFAQLDNVGNIPNNVTASYAAIAGIANNALTASNALTANLATFATTALNGTQWATTADGIAYGDGDVTIGLGSQPGIHVSKYQPIVGTADNQTEMTALFANSTYASSFISPNVYNVSLHQDQYAMLFEGNIVIPTTGTYLFGLGSDDASDAFIDNVKIADFYGAHGGNVNYPGGAQYPISLTAGTHNLKVRFVEFGGGDFVSLLWSQDNGSTWQPVPDSWFTYATPTLSNLKLNNTLIITGSNGVLTYGTIDTPGYVTLADIHAYNDSPWLERFYNDTFSTSSAAMAYFAWNDGRFVFHNESTQSIGLQVNGYEAQNGLLVYEDKVAFVNNIEVTGSIIIPGGYSEYPTILNSNGLLFPTSESFYFGLPSGFLNLPSSPTSSTTALLSIGTGSLAAMAWFGDVSASGTNVVELIIGSGSQGAAFPLSGLTIATAKSGSYFNGSGSGDCFWVFNGDDCTFTAAEGGIKVPTGSIIVSSGSIEVTGSLGVSGPIYLSNGGSINDSGSTTIITPPGALPGQSLVIRPTAPNLISDHPSGFYSGDSITITFTPSGGTVTGTGSYTFTGCTEVQLGTSLTGSLLFENEVSQSLTWTVPALSDITGFTFDIYNFATFTTNSISLSSSGSSEHSHVHLISGNPTTTDIYLGDDDQYIKIEKNAGNVVIGTNLDTHQWIFDTSGSLTTPGSVNVTGSLTQNGYEVKPYKVYTALLTQTGNSDPQSQGSGAVTQGVTYYIDGADVDSDFSNVGGPIGTGGDGTYFVATNSNVPNNYGAGNLQWDNGAPVVTVLENTIGNIWWTYSGQGQYSANSSNLFMDNKTICQTNQISDDNNTMYLYEAYQSNTSYCTIITSDGSSGINGLLGSGNKAWIEIRVYN